MSRFTGTPEQQHLCYLLRQIRIEAGLKQAELAERLGESQSFVSKYEMGERRLDILELRNICKALDLPLTDFVRKFERTHGAKSTISKSPQTILGKRSKH